jgi:hypothetical protein
VAIGSYFVELARLIFLFRVGLAHQIFYWRCSFGGPGGDAHGRAPLFRPVITFLPSRRRSKVDRFINRRGIIELVGFAVPTSPIRAPLDRFRVGLMAEIPARENFKSTKTSKTS